MNQVRHRLSDENIRRLIALAALGMLATIAVYAINHHENEATARRVTRIETKSPCLAFPHSHLCHRSFTAAIHTVTPSQVCFLFSLVNVTPTDCLRIEHRHDIHEAAHNPTPPKPTPASAPVPDKPSRAPPTVEPADHHPVSPEPPATQPGHHAHGHHAHAHHHAPSPPPPSPAPAPSPTPAPAAPAPPTPVPPPAPGNSGETPAPAHPSVHVCVENPLVPACVGVGAGS
jgi:hypothetical protein